MEKVEGIFINFSSCMMIWWIPFFGGGGVIKVSRDESMKPKQSKNEMDKDESFERSCGKRFTAV